MLYIVGFVHDNQRDIFCEDMFQCVHLFLINSFSSKHNLWYHWHSSTLLQIMICNKTDAKYLSEAKMKIDIFSFQNICFKMTLQKSI